MNLIAAIILQISLKMDLSISLIDTVVNAKDVDVVYQIKKDDIYVEIDGYRFEFVFKDWVECQDNWLYSIDAVGKFDGCNYRITKQNFDNGFSIVVQNLNRVPPSMFLSYGKRRDNF